MGNKQCIDSECHTHIQYTLCVVQLYDVCMYSELGGVWSEASGLLTRAKLKLKLMDVACPMCSIPFGSGGNLVTTSSEKRVKEEE